MSKYSRIRRANTTRLPNYIDFTDHSIPSRNQNSSTKPKDTAAGVSNAENPTQDANGVTDDGGEVFGVILGRKLPPSCSDSSSKLIAEKEHAKLQRSVNKSFSIKRSISLSEGYSRIHDQYDPFVEDKKGGVSTLPTRPSKKKGQIFKSWKSFFSF
ncbi:hypothetical protein LIER_15347 [Lithospermum erythrorhizon]|uniref:Uncharacterized protein n=1 Tax=Lithospermum erythrorhizon TaxID=34254 RepID=A0AAV3Q6K2_LITER